MSEYSSLPKLDMRFSNTPDSSWLAELVGDRRAIAASVLVLGAGFHAAYAAFRRLRQPASAAGGGGGGGSFEANYKNFLKPCRTLPSEPETKLSRSLEHRTLSTKASSTQGLQIGDEAGQNSHVMPASCDCAPSPHCSRELGDGDIRILLLYGTEYGFSREVAHRVAADIGVGPFRVAVQDMADYAHGYHLEEEQVVLFVCSTQGDGVPPSEARAFVDWLDKDAKAMQGVHFSVLALGDRSYTHFAACGKRLDCVMERKGASRMDVHMEDWRTITEWTKGIRAALPCLELKPTKALCQSNTNFRAVCTQEGTTPRYGRRNPFPARVTSMTSLCVVVEPGDKETVQIELDLDPQASGLSYIPGDALGVMPVNSSQVVQELLEALGADGGCMVEPPSWYTGPVDAGLNLQDALARCYDLHRPRRGLVDALLAEHSSDAIAAPISNLEHLTAVSQKDADAIKAYLSVRHVIDVLRDFLPSTVELPVFLANLRPLQPRLYSISSSPLEAPGMVQVTVAIVRYKSLGVERFGVASTYLGKHTKTGDKVAVYVANNPDFRLPRNPNLPIVMVGPGTGVAPFRAFVQHRLLESSVASQESLLFFGCRHKDRDYLYRPLLEGWDQDGIISLHTAFSRDLLSKKAYVQHRLAEKADDVWRVLSAGGHFYVCGDAARMAEDVHQTLLTICAHRLVPGGHEAAERFIQRLRSTERYQKDVWFS